VSTGSLLGVVGTLALVLGLMALALRLLRRFAAHGSVKRGRLPLEVVQRVSLGPKQGIAVVRIGERVLAVSLGEGGVRPLAELGEAERALLAAPARSESGSALVPAAARTALGRFAGLASIATTNAAPPTIERATTPDATTRDATMPNATAAGCRRWCRSRWPRRSR
jgi:flagellar biosynthetic protein FliP